MRYELITNKEIGKIETFKGKYIVVRQTQYQDEQEPLMDIRYWQDLDDIKGFSRKGIRIPLNKIDDLVRILTEPIKKENKNGDKQ